MIHVPLIRLAYLPTVTLGRLTLPDGVRLYTVERPWIENRPSISCIPEGEYECAPRRFFRGGYEAAEVLNVPGRSHILFHVGNWARDVEGCIAVVSELGCVNGEIGGSRSKPAFAEFMRQVGGAPFALTIDQVSPARLPAPSIV